jgi:hypothetical protein
MRHLTHLALAAALVAGANAGVVRNSPPFCNDFAPFFVPCQGATTTVTVTTDAYDPDGDDFTIEWLPCPGAYATDPTALVTDIVIDTSVTCDRICGIRTRLIDEHGATFVCRQYVGVFAAPEGCTPGYWKTHADAWAGTGYSPTDDFDTVFGVDAFTPDITLMQAAWLGGGGANKLARHSVAALLNASDSEVNYPLTQAEVLASVQNAYNTQTYEPLATNLDSDNNLGCPKN